MPNRRRVLQTLAGLPVLGAAGWALYGPVGANAYYRGPISDHFDGVRFFNPSGARPKGPLAFLRWQLFERGIPWPDSYPSPFRDLPPARFEGEGARLSFVGHASFLVQTRGKNLLLDPVWSERASPVAFAGPKRVNAPGIAFSDLPPIDAVLVTHNHYDHMDVPTIGRLCRRFQPRIVTPLGNDTILRAGVPGCNVQACDWGESVDLGAGVRIHVEPCVHWSARGTTDRMHALWASFVIEAGPTKIYYVGDTGLGDGSVARRVGARHPGLAAALLPIGAYEPRWFLRSQHMNPEEAVAACELSGAQRGFGHHWGTFRLTNEAIEQPLSDLAAALAKRGLAPERFAPLRPGEVRLLR
jgi:L-ascorbate metabolism protein UlaG (beta-lactamase superfamily)